MNEYILFMYDDAADLQRADDAELWNEYIAALHASGRFDGGSSIGEGVMFKKAHADRAPHPNINGYIRVRAEDLAGAKQFLHGNPTYEAGGTVEVRELLRS